MTNSLEKPSPLEVIRLGHPVLRQVAEPVPEEFFGTDRLADLSRDMIRTMLSEDGVGLAAPQVSENLRLFVYWVPGDDDHPDIAPQFLANPEIKPAGDLVEVGWEGCLSIPGLRGLVPRFSRIKVSARDLEGNPVSLTADGFHARVMQHEFDHLDGIVFLDRMESPASLAYEHEWERYVLNQPDDAQGSDL
ncbi:MAG: peptide deformylase [Acidobacteria bacterium]|nr:peptide deformylase [Acidobacteriota bacterium]